MNIKAKILVQVFKNLLQRQRRRTSPARHISLNDQREYVSRRDTHV